MKYETPEEEMRYIKGELKATLLIFSNGKKIDTDFERKINAVNIDAIELLRLLQQSINLQKIEIASLQAAIKRMNQDNARINQIDLFAAKAR